ncbi:testis-specific H1 histone [Notamacropus eugenii]|uniref:testis-specific H1 histone n=1 Tax=Notamacropus eugenii TaxID=9315 RepID=UPI003B67192C
MVKSQTSRPALAGAGGTMTEAADPDGLSKERVPESSEKPQDTQVKHRRRSVLRVSQLLLRAIAAHKGLTLTMLKKEFGNAGYQVRRKCSGHSAEVAKPASGKGTLLRVSGSKAEGYFRVWKSLKPVKKRPKKSLQDIEELHQKRFEALFSRRFRKSPQEASPPNSGDSFKPETPEEEPETPEMSETPQTSEEKIYVEQVNDNSEDMEGVALSLGSGYSLSHKGSKKTREETGYKAKQQKIKKMKMREKSKSPTRSTEGSKRPKTKKEKKTRIQENKRAKASEDRKVKSKEKAKEKVRDKADSEKRQKPKQGRQNYGQRYGPNRNLASAKSSKIYGGRVKGIDPRAKRPNKGSPRKESSRKEST